MNAIVPIEEGLRKSIIPRIARKYDLDPNAFELTMRSIMPTGGTWEEFASFLVVCNNYNLNPITKQIYAMKSKRGGIQPIVSIDGWLFLINNQPQMDGMVFNDTFDKDGKLTAVTCTIHRKDRKFPTEVTEYMAECFNDTEPWKKWPARMLRHKATIQCGRYAFNLSGIMDEDEFYRLQLAEQAGRENAPSSKASTAGGPPAPPGAKAKTVAETNDQTFPIDDKVEDVEIVEVTDAELPGAKIARWTKELTGASRDAQDKLFSEEIDPFYESGAMASDEYNRLVALSNDS